MCRFAQNPSETMRTLRGVVAAVLVAGMVQVGTGPSLASCPAAARPPDCVNEPPDSASGPISVVALIDSGINPYAPAFRDSSGLAYKHPSKYIPGYPKDAIALRLSIGKPFEKAMKLDAEVWKSVLPGKLYWIPGTRFIGAISFGAGGTRCPVVEMPPANAVSTGECEEHRILDDHGHGTMTASRAAGSPSSLAPTARIVAIEGLGAKGVRWAADQGWIDVQSNSWVNLVPPPIPGATTEAFAYAAGRHLTLAASGNGAAYLAGFAPTPTYLLSTAPPGVILVGGHDNGKMTLWSGAPPHVVADAYGGMTAINTSSENMRPDPIACCTSAASPYAAGGAAAIVMEARRLLGARGSGVEAGVVACGDPGKISKGPLADGTFTLDELKDVYLHTADPRPPEGRDDGLIHWAGEPRAPDYVEFGPGANPFCFGCTTTAIPWASVPEQADAYAQIGYGAINERSVTLAAKILSGAEEIPVRASADAQYEADQQARAAIFSLNGFEDTAEAKAC